MQNKKEKIFMARKAVVVRIVLERGRVIEVKKTETHATIVLKEGGSCKSKIFPAKNGTTVEVSENKGNVSVTLRPSRGKLKMEMMKF